MAARPPRSAGRRSDCAWVACILHHHAVRLGCVVRASGAGLVSHLAMMLIVAVSIQACASTRTVTQVLADPGRYRDRDVKVVGDVTDSVGLLGYGLFKLDDGTGQLWVSAAADCLGAARTSPCRAMS